MQIVFEDGGQRREIDVRVNNPAATVADLADALAPGGVADRTLLIGGVPADSDLELAEAGLHEGAAVAFSPSTTTRIGNLSDTGLELAVVNGMDAGRRFRLPEGTTVLGRSPACDAELRHATVSKRHAAICVSDDDISIRDLESHNGTWIDGVAVDDPISVPLGQPVRVGALTIEVRDARTDDRPVGLDPLRHVTGAGTLPFNRPPRPAPPSAHDDVLPPAPPRSSGGRTPLSVIGIITPVLFAGVMYAVLRSPQVLLFAGLTPIMAIANTVDSRRRGKKTDRSEAERFTAELTRFRADLAEAGIEERDRRRTQLPDPAEVARRASLPSTMVWERRPGHADFLRLRVGVGEVPWVPPVPDLPKGAATPEELRAAVREVSVLPAAPVGAELAGGGVVGIVGDRGAALALARSLVCQAAVHHGPADVPMMVLASPDSAAAWDWAKWLPHTRDSSGATRMLSGDPGVSTRLVEARLKAAGKDRTDRLFGERSPVGPTVLVVVDDETLTEGRRAPTRSLLRGDAGPVAGVVIATTTDRLPAVCSIVVELDGPHGEARVRLPQQGQLFERVVVAGMADDVARTCARDLARFEDPELDIVGAGLPGSIRLLPLLELEECTSDAIVDRWKAGGTEPAPATPIGVAENGVFAVDFVLDGPHGLVGGTTGAGKSELLRSLVAGLAATVDPDHLTFVLVDFKGGSAFDECARLPHTVGLVTDLDEHLAERALRCLEAELKHRERRLREAGATDLADYLRSGGQREPLPRLLVIIDEFATLRAELPEFIDALVGVAQRGRSLGVHLLLATQRPQGAISENIKANTNLRIALRMQDKSDSSDVIDVPDAAAIPRTAPGRAYVRLGPNEVVAIQTALSTGLRNEASLVHVDVAPFVYGPLPRPAASAAISEGDGTAVTDLTVLVDAINEAFVHSGREPPRRPWPDPLPVDVDLDALVDRAIADAAGGRPPFVPVALADDPDRQRQYPTGWNLTDGNLLVYGVGGSGTTTAVSSLALALARLHAPDALHIYAIDFGAGELAELAALPHCGAVVLANERERQHRLIRFLRSELDARRQLGAAERRARPTVATFVDGYAAFAADYQDVAGQELLEAFIRVFADGPEVGLYTVITGDRSGAIAHSLASTARQRWVFRMADPSEYAVGGISSRAVPAMVSGHALVAETKQLVHVARPPDGVAAAVERIRAATAPIGSAAAPTKIATLPVEVGVAEIGAAALGSRPWRLPVGIAESTLGPAALVVYEGEHVLVAGPARSGRSSALATIAAVCRAGGELQVLAVTGPRSPLGSDPNVDHAMGVDTLEAALTPLLAEPSPVLVLIDDAETVDDPGGYLDRLLAGHPPNLLVVAAGRNDALRAMYSGWTRTLRRSKVGVLLRPDPDLDGDLLGARLPRRAPVAMGAPGRGYVVNGGDATLAQLAR